jgi:N-acetylglucosamine-6-phosphate deacetylase
MDLRAARCSFVTVCDVICSFQCKTPPSPKAALRRERDEPRGFVAYERMSAQRPRYFDFQVNGFAGVDFQSAALTAPEMIRSARALVHQGVAGVFLTLITDGIDALCGKLRRLESIRGSSPEVNDMIRGYHLEGPWLSPLAGFCGAHPPDLMRRPEIEDFERLQLAAGGRVRIVTLAPELPGSRELIAHLRARGVHVSIGHTDASDLDIDMAIAAGARFCTHLGNATPLMLPRHDNVVQRLLARDELTACLIPDGLHLPRSVLKNFVRAKPAGKVLFTTDAMAGAGAGPGRYTLGSSHVEVGADGAARHPTTGGFAGSTLTPAQGVANCAEYLGCSVADAEALWSTRPAEAFGLGPSTKS